MPPHSAVCAEGTATGGVMATIVGRVGRALARLPKRIIQHFPDAAMELAYLTEQRSRQAKFTRTLSLIIGVAIIAYVVTSFIFMRADAFKTVGLANLYFIPVMLTYAWAVGQRGYITRGWIDVAFFAAVLPGMYVTNMQMVAAHANNWPLSAQFTYSHLLAMAGGMLAFSASVTEYLVLVTGSVVYVGVVLTLKGLPAKEVGYALNSYGTFAAVLAYVNWAIDDKARRVFKLNLDLDLEKAKSDRLLENVLPPVIAARLREEEEVADAFDGVAILFADIAGFTRLSERLGSHGTVEMLTAYFSKADKGCELFGIEKIKTIGDAYMAVAGALTKPALPAKAAVDFGAFLVRAAREVGEEMGLDLHVRVGVNMGEVIGGVIGTERLSYDYWGDTINVAARLEGLARVDGITVSEGVYEVLRGTYGFHEPRRAMLKNLGERPVYDVDVDTVPHAAVAHAA